MTINEIIKLWNIAKNDVQSIRQEMLDEVDAQAELSGLNSPSAQAEFRKWIDVFAILGATLWRLVTEAIDHLNEIKDSGIAANRAFFKREWKAFQFGDSLLLDDSTARYYYENENTEKQIVTRLAIVQASDTWIVKAAKADGALSVEERVAFQAYVDLTQPPGPQIQVLSVPSDKIEARFTIYYNPITPVEVIKPLVEQAYKDYLDTIDIEEQSVYRITKHIDALQEASDAIIDVRENEVKAAPDGEVLTVLDRYYEPYSGYLELNEGIEIENLISYEPSPFL